MDPAFLFREHYEQKRTAKELIITDNYEARNKTL